MNSQQNQTENDKVRYLLSTGAVVTGGVIGAALSLITVNPALTIVLGGAGAAIGKGIADIVDKQLSSREKSRTAVAAAESIVSISAALEQGMTIREDDFLNSNDGSRSSCDEIFEGMLLSAKNEHEEKKIKYVANIFSNTVFNDITIGEANHLLKIATDLTYRQMCVLSLVEQKRNIPGISLGKKFLLEDKEMDLLSNEEKFLRQEIMDLYNKGLIYVEHDGQGLALLDIYNIIPDNMKFTELGLLCYSIMGLDNIPVQDLIDIGKLLKI